MAASTESDTTVSGTIRSAEIISCGGWQLNRFPLLKSFLKDGEAEWYVHVKVTYIPHHPAIMFLYEADAANTTNKVLVEQIELQPLNDKVKLHKLMLAKGFQLKPEIAQQRKKESSREVLEEEEDDNDTSSSYDFIDGSFLPPLYTQLYSAYGIGITMVLIVFAVILLRRSSRTRRSTIQYSQLLRSYRASSVPAT